ncbi:hypothetical protein LPC08_01975 [Roseomonas sp. OT10]|uniref:hypothetical protein n=1 Tax=Roseomonas cutis TaxID=2897332 RepID=UPI001E45E627|nr:hypothetical protein [Roseomonas sp. OT10]UFN49437.1 hypothetical protein LPC08_01975 [Roseomonas sp. OT10]
MPDSDPVVPVELADLEEALRFALGWDERGMPLPDSLRTNGDFLAKRIATHLRQRRFVVMRRLPSPEGSLQYGMDLD